MTSKPFINFFETVFSKNTLAAKTFLIICLFSLTSCNVDPSFGYAFAGTGAVMLVALVIATVVTSRNKKRGGEGEK